MALDPFGKPLSTLPPFELNLQQKRQATLLYHWMSLDYLRELKALIDALIRGADVDLELAKMQGRDAVLSNDRWGVRDTSANWSTFVFPAIEDFRKSTSRLIAWRASQIYCGTGATQCSRMIDEFSSMWMTEDEEKRFKAQFEKVCQHAQFIDFAAGIGGVRHQLNDYSMSLYWNEWSSRFPLLPKFRVRTDVEGTTNKMPSRTGVYVAQDDPYATLQFGWTGDNDGILGDAQTLNAIGHRATTIIGRDALWGDGHKIASYAIGAFQRRELTDYDFFKPGDESNPQYAPWLVYNSSAVSRACRWFFVEMVNGEFDEQAAAVTSSTSAPKTDILRCQAGKACPQEGWWFTPAGVNSRRYFTLGEVMPSLGGDYGDTIWQWADNQSSAGGRS